MANIVHCRVCGAEIDKRTKEGAEWIMPSKNFYYHPTCYADYQKKKNDIHAKADDKIWFDSLKDYLAKDLKMGVNYSKITSQWQSFLKKGMTAKGIYFAIKYYYETQNGDIKKSEGGIGIVPLIYNDSKEYWVNREMRETGICEKITRQLMERQSQKVIIVQQKEAKKEKGYTDWSIIANMPEDEEC